MLRTWTAVAACSLAALGCVCACRRAADPVRLPFTEATLRADGWSSADAGEGVALRVIEGARHVRVEGSRIIASVLPGRALVQAHAEGFRPVRIPVRTTPVDVDEALRLDSAADRAAFRAWFVAIAESWYWQQHRLPRDIDDCAALLRHAYREALREHDAEWLANAGLVAPPAGGEVRKYRYPFTPIAPSLFEIAPAKYAEFADAGTLLRRNTHAVSRDLLRAQPGDLLFFRQGDQRLPFHTMIVGSDSHVVYHTGEEPGEIRRLTYRELLQHRNPQWRALPGNPNFLGVRRWNILEEEDR